LLFPTSESRKPPTFFHSLADPLEIGFSERRPCLSISHRSNFYGFEHLRRDAKAQGKLDDGHRWFSLAGIRTTEENSHAPSVFKAIVSRSRSVGVGSAQPQQIRLSLTGWIPAASAHRSWVLNRSRIAVRRLWRMTPLENFLIPTPIRNPDWFCPAGVELNRIVAR